MTALLAGFECGRLGWNGHDLLRTTRHMPEDRMPAHYAIARQHGLTRSRDGLPWRHDPRPRLRCAHAAGMSVIWDLNHFDPPDDPAAHARRVAEAANRAAPLWICPVNEPSLYPRLCGMPQQASVHLAITMARVAKDHHPEVRILSTDPITGIGERQFAATDALVAAGLVDVVGVNYYPHTARTSLYKVLTKVARRYRLPIMVAETSWHDGHPIHHRRHPGWSKGDWLRHILQDVAAAEQNGADVVGVCWYPFVDCPPWHRPRSRQRWSHGLIRQDLGVDPHLAAALQEHRSEPQQLRLDYDMAI
ncbi:glycosyl hydrolase 53 family protein [Lichenifustis flavocetrariae]|uniref:Glycosyl hydrolase 53 family protein n=1 Tax=Lichenifustis flavocetrariae TaxID=2949735 RepID=A0AA41ZCA6_9HYPH|nr:glycosyl hydrolase 53 family protein [Lichenifustis flavocetrariae]MCW6513257.1 glycosyl hydrolase 53 family protein [Lichenifustis flavocetrariae]